MPRGIVKSSWTRHETFDLDFAVASIALSIKVCSVCITPVPESVLISVHPGSPRYPAPLNPIYARHYLILAPHNMSRKIWRYTIVTVFISVIVEQISLGFATRYPRSQFVPSGVPTPQAYLDEVYLVLPILRRIFPEHRWTLIKIRMETSASSCLRYIN